MKPRILIVEDDPFMAQIIAGQVTELGYHPVATCAYGEEAVETAGKQPCDLALVDLRLAGKMDGLATASLLREKFSVPSVLITAAPDPKLIERAIESQPYGYLTKPFTTTVLRLTVEMALQRLHAETALREREEQLEAVLRTSMDSFWILGVDGSMIDVNDAACRMTGYSREELLRMNLFQLEYGRTLAQIAEGIEQLLRVGSTHIERVTRRKDGELRVIDMSVTCSPPPLRRLYCFGRDITDRRHSELALRESERHLRATLDSLPDSATLKDNEGRYLAVNAVWRARYNQTQNEVLGKTDFDLFPYGLALEYARRDEQVRQSLSPVCTEIEHTTADGTVVWLEIHKKPFLDAENRCAGLVCISRDITRQRMAAARLRLYKWAVEQSPASIVITNPHGDIEYVNPYFERTTGYSSREVIGLNPRVLKSCVQPKSFYEELWATIAAGRDWRGEFCNKKKDGTLYWEQASISPVRDEQGKIVQFIAVKEDITEHKLAQESLSRRQSYFSAIIENQPGMLWLKDTASRFLTVNQTFALSAGHTNPDDLVSLTDLDVWPKDLAEKYRADDQRVMQARKTVSVEEPVETVDGRRWFETFKSPVFTPHGEIIGVTGYSHDITDRKREQEELIRAKEEAESANRAKSAFLATMSHELRTPLNVINGMSAILAQEDWLPEHKHAIDLISEGGHALLSIIEEILDYSGLQAGKTKLEETPFSVASVVGSALRLCAASAQTKGLNLTCSLDPKTPEEALGDPRRLKQILVNLMQNAIKFTERGRIHLRLSVRTGTSGSDTFDFCIFDSGIGITSENVGKLFRPFSQADASITRRFGGTGLGLAITKSFVNLMGGDISVRSRPNLGSVFRFQVILKSTAKRATAFSRLSNRRLQKRRVLLLEGTGAQQRMLEALVRSWDMDVAVIPLASSTYPEVGCDIAILPIQEATDMHHPLFSWLAEQGRGAKIPIAWLGRKDLAAPAFCTAPSVRLGTHIDPVELSLALVDLLSATATGSSVAHRGRRSDKARSLGETLPLSILAAEDNRTNREVIKLVLKNIGYAVDLVENGAEAVLAVKNKKYDLLLLDMQMPIMDGLTAAREICRLIPDPSRRLKIVALTANALPGDRERCLAAGMDAYLTKPILPVDLASCIRHVFQPSESANPVAPSSLTIQATTSERPWIDTRHLEEITPGMNPEQARETLRQLHLSVCNDFNETAPTVATCCEQQDQAHFAETIHGLKGCFMMIGWNRAGFLCADALVAARKGEFTEWKSFVEELKSCFRHSSERMSAYLDNRNLPDVEAPTPSSPASSDRLSP